MKLDQDEQKRGMIWLIGAGLAGLALTIFLARADLTLTYSDSREEDNLILEELRTAATSLSSGSRDSRLLAPGKRKVDQHTVSAQADQSATHH